MEKIEHQRSGHRGAFVILRDGEKLAEQTYTVAGSRVVIDHTDVDDRLRDPPRPEDTDVADRLRGTGPGRKLVQAAVEWARPENVKLMPLCPFAKSVFEKTPDYADVLAK